MQIKKSYSGVIKMLEHMPGFITELIYWSPETNFNIKNP